MKIRSIAWNNHRKILEIKTARNLYQFPFSKLEPKPTSNDKIKDAYIDKELASEAVTFRLESGQEGTVHLDQILEYNRDPHYLTELKLYELTLEAQRRLTRSPITKRELTRRLNTSPSQIERLLDQTNYKKSINQMIELLYLLDCEVSFEFLEREAVHQ